MKLRIILALFLGAAFTGCEKIDELTQFDVDLESMITIQAGTPLDLPINILTPDIETDYEAVYSAYDTRADRIEEVQLSSLTLEIISPESGNFNFLESIDLSMQAGDDEAESIAYKTSIADDNAITLELETSSANLKDYLSIDNFKLKLNCITDEILTADHDIKVKMKFFVDARVLGQ